MLMTKVDKRSARKKRASKKTRDLKQPSNFTISRDTGPHQRNQGKFRGRRKATQ